MITHDDNKEISGLLHIRNMTALAVAFGSGDACSAGGGVLMEIDTSWNTFACPVQGRNALPMRRRVLCCWELQATCAGALRFRVEGYAEMSALGVCG